MFDYPTGIAADSAGNLFISTTASVRKINAAGKTFTLAGPIFNPSSPLEPAALAGLLSVGSPEAIAVDAQGTALYIVQGNAVMKGQRAAAPVITTQPQNASVASGGSVQFSVGTSGAPAPAYQWFFNGSPFEGATGSTLSFSNARSSDAGNYSVTVTNALGSVSSSSAALTVSSGGSSGGGGGAPSPAFLVALLVLAGVRRLTGQPRSAAS